MAVRTTALDRSDDRVRATRDVAACSRHDVDDGVARYVEIDVDAAFPPVR